MIKRFYLLAFAIVLGGAGTAICYSHSIDTEKDTAKAVYDGKPSYVTVAPAPAITDYSPCEVMRPEAAMISKDELSYGNDVVPGIKAPVIPVARPPNGVIC